MLVQWVTCGVLFFSCLPSSHLVSTDGPQRWVSVPGIPFWDGTELQHLTSIILSIRIACVANNPLQWLSIAQPNTASRIQFLTTATQTRVRGVSTCYTWSPCGWNYCITAPLGQGVASAWKTAIQIWIRECTVRVQKAVGICQHRDWHPFTALAEAMNGCSEDFQGSEGSAKFGLVCRIVADACSCHYQQNSAHNLYFCMF